MKNILIFILIAMPSLTQAQLLLGDTLFYDENGNPSEQSNCSYYKIFTENEQSKILTSKTFYPNHQIRTIQHFKDRSKTLKIDSSTAYYPSGNLHWQRAYNEKGQPIYLRQIYENGNLKRLETYKDGLFHKGKKYDSLGKRIAFTKFQTAPKYNGGDKRLIAYLNRTIRYPSKARDMNIAGTVIVSFIVSKENEVLDPTIIKSVHPLLDQEAIRVVSIMKQWRAGTLNDENINSRISIPITFGKPKADEHIPIGG